jgi:lysophospholipase L1-like esterase
MMSFSLASTRLGCGGNRAVIPLPQVRYPWMARHVAKVAETKQRASDVKLLFIGDSITQNYERSEGPFRNFAPIWDELIAPHGALNLGVDGDRTYNVLWRLQHGEADGLQPDDIVLLIGTNNLNPGTLEPHAETADQVSQGTLAVVTELHARMPAARILVLSILPSSYSAERTAKTNAVNAQVQAAMAKLSFARYLDVSGIFMDGQRVREELFYDGLESPGSAALHPTVAGQRQMAEAVLAALYAQKPPA